MGHLAFQQHLILFLEAVKRQLHLETTVAAKRHRLQTLIGFTARKNCFTGLGFFSKLCAIHLHTAEPLFRQRMCRHRPNIRLKALDEPLRFLNLRREIFHQFIFQSVLLALMIRLQYFQPCNIYIQVHFLLDLRVSGTKCLDLCIGKSLLIYIITGTYRRFAGHDLADKFLLILQCLIEVGIKSSFRHILINLHFFVSVSLTDDTTISLGHVRRPPAHIQMMHGHQPVLHVRACTHLLCRT